VERCIEHGEVPIRIRRGEADLLRNGDDVRLDLAVHRARAESVRQRRGGDIGRFVEA